MDDKGPILIAGGGMAGSLLALVLARRGLAVTVVDPRRTPPPVFRNEKLGHAQIAILSRLGALAPFQAACWPQGAYPGHRPELYDCGAPHQAWLAAVRAAWPASVRFESGTVAAARLGADRQAIVLADGRRLEGRLMVLATGRMPALAQALGIGRQVISPGHSVCLGFSVDAAGDPPARVLAAAFGSGLGYVSLFPMPGELRVNVFSYRSLDDPWTRRMRADPVAALAELAPEAAALLEGRAVVRRCEARGTDIYRARGHLQRAGLVLLGDAAHAPCPASGTGMLRILTDVEALADRCLPAWLATPGMGADKIAGFYADPAKRRCEAASLRSSLRGRAKATSAAPAWRLRRAASRLRGARALQATASAISGAWAGRMRRSASGTANQATRSSSG
ncbi:MAG: FAD-dependent monooxygenase [Caulobacteraceae bacterium]|nr:FAD-dependent monooxygenase [Caulobacter sp.]